MYPASPHLPVSIDLGLDPLPGMRFDGTSSYPVRLFLDLTARRVYLHADYDFSVGEVLGESVPLFEWPADRSLVAVLNYLTSPLAQSNLVRACSDVADAADALHELRSGAPDPSQSLAYQDAEEWLSKLDRVQALRYFRMAQGFNREGWYIDNRGTTPGHGHGGVISLSEMSRVVYARYGR